MRKKLEGARDVQEKGQRQEKSQMLVSCRCKCYNLKHYEVQVVRKEDGLKDKQL